MGLEVKAAAPKNDLLFGDSRRYDLLESIEICRVQNSPSPYDDHVFGEFLLIPNLCVSLGESREFKIVQRARYTVPKIIYVVDPDANDGLHVYVAIALRAARQIK